MSVSRHIQRKNGKMAGSIGAGKDNAPVEVSIATLRRIAYSTSLTGRETISVDELADLARHDEEQRAAAARAEEEARQEADRAASEKAAFWAAFRPEPGTLVPPTYESHQHLPIGTVVELVGADADKYWNGTVHVKTGPSSWASVTWRRSNPGSASLSAEHLNAAAELVAARATGVSPCPRRRDGQWKILAVLP